MVLPTKAIRHEKILEALMYQANTGQFRDVPDVTSSYIQACEQMDQEAKAGAPAPWDSVNISIG